MSTPLSRRDFIRLGRDAAGLIALGSLPAFGDERRPRFDASPFRLGVASGDPVPGGVVLWTRLDAGVLERAGAARLAVPVRWEIAEDDRFRRIVRRGSQLAISDLGHSVHAEVAGLKPGRHYWYRFDAGGEVSAIGRTRTAPAAREAAEQFRYAFVSCQNYEAGYFTAYRHLAEEDIDLVVHLGDYIYETGSIGDRAVRLQESAGELLTLAQYRARYEHYKADPDLQAAHARVPFVVTADDHEVKNDYAGATAPTWPVPPDQFLLRRASAYQAYYEFMPLRRAAMPAGPDMRLFRRLRFGTLAELHMLDTRQYRTPEACGGGGRRTRCDEALSRSREMLGAAQEQWLMNGLRAPGATWNLLANQVFMAQLALVANGERMFSMDNWNGYVEPRWRLMKFLDEARPSNPVVMTGDVHTNWVADLKVDFDDPSSPTVATELIGTAISSGGDGDDSGRPDVLSANPHMKFFNNRRGYVRCAITRSSLTADFRTLPYVTRPGAPIETAASFVIEAGRPGAVRL